MRNDRLISAAKIALADLIGFVWCAANSFYPVSDSLVPREKFLKAKSGWRKGADSNPGNL